MAKLQPGHGVGPCLQASRSRSPHLGVVRHDRKEGLKWLDRDKQVHELGFYVGWHRVPKHPQNLTCLPLWLQRAPRGQVFPLIL